MRQATADYRQQLNQLNKNVLAQEELTIQERQDSDRLAALFEKYASGESGGELLILAFERLQRDRQRFRNRSVKEIQAQLRVSTQLLYKAEDQLYGYDRQVASRLENVLTDAQALPVPLRKAFDEQKGALRDQQQVLRAMAQAYTDLLSLHREHRRLLEDSHFTALTKMFWLRDAERFNLTIVRQMMTGVGLAMSQFREMIDAERVRLRTVLTGALHLWVLAAVLLVFVPWIAYKICIYLRESVTSLLSRCAERAVPCGMFGALLIVARAAIWPAYLILLAWSWTQFIPREAAATDWLLSSSLQVCAAILFAALFGRDLLRPKGWGQQFWGWRPELCRFLYRIVLIGCLAATVLMVPRHILLTAPGQAEAATASLALARFLLLVFQSVILVIIAVVGWRQNPLMEERLTRSEQAGGLLWRLWPFIYLLALTGLVGIITLDLLGYRYAARFIWLRGLESFSILLLWRLLMTLLLVRILQQIVAFLVRLWSRDQRGPSTTATPFDQVFRLAYMAGNTVLAIVAASAILEIWGVSVSWFVMSPLGGDVIRRGVVIAITIGLMVLVMKISKAITEYLVQPQTTSQGAINQPNRKFRTMVPLFHTLFKFGVVFSAIIVVLQQLNVAIGPILTGVGIFGLAVGFASQSLIKDVINGLFLLFEDSLSVGDIVTLRGITGEVEKVTLRAVTIRDLEGNVHVIPNSTLDLITNMTKVYSRQVIDVGVAYREDVDVVIEILREVSDELRNDPVLGWDMMEPLEIMGVHDFSDSAVIIRTRLRTLPGKQWRLGRELRRRIKKAFDERGIEIPFPHRTIYWGMPKASPQPPIQISLDPPPPSQRTDNGVPRPADRQPPPIIED
ncbi:mechanosensitive ion channel domain-containing protein [Candidatus Entotheonella palauensis]|nr:mechanosensitive ion channel domain-containing protein [Candidatus Entotheonella palauensis]